ncbi:MAG: hypothetical protein SRB2_02060 [Desulfobacteraceae bacterium Eth-SRB2]|nr:MAG: hypothetical protein SRB2_02060 [Desulfobacteraceae bacterium Eth-SRB2]
MGTFLSFLTRADQYGLLAFEDRRKSAYKKVVTTEAPVKVSLAVTEQNVIIQLGGNNQEIIIPRKNLLQCKVILLTFVNNGLLTAKEVSDVLGFSVRHTRDLNGKMHEEDVYCLIDKRKGQIQDYRFTPEIGYRSSRLLKLNRQTQAAPYLNRSKSDVTWFCLIALYDYT